MKEILPIAVGGALGSVARFFAANALYYSLGKDFPYGTFLVNVLGSFLMGFLSILILDRLPHYNPQLAGFLLVGFLGAFTTFSTFSMDTLRLFYDGHVSLGVVNVVSNVTLCLLGVFLGYALAVRIFHVS